MDKHIYKSQSPYTSSIVSPVSQSAHIKTVLQRTSNLIPDYQTAEWLAQKWKSVDGWDLIAVGSGNYVDKLVDMTGSIIALSVYYISAQ